MIPVLQSDIRYGNQQPIVFRTISYERCSLAVCLFMRHGTVHGALNAVYQCRHD